LFCAALPFLPPHLLFLRILVAPLRLFVTRLRCWRTDAMRFLCLFTPARTFLRGNLRFCSSLLPYCYRTI